MSNGFIVQIIGAVVDIEFPQNAVPQVYDALKVVSEGQGQGLVLEVQQQIGGGVVRCITMGSSDGPVSYTHLDVYKRQPVPCWP